MKITHIIAPAQFGGLERVVASLAGGHAARGHAVSAISLSSSGRPEPPVLNDLRDAGVEVRAIVLPPRSFREQLRGVKQALASLRPDVAHSHGYLSDVILGLTKQKNGPAIVATAHGFTGGDRKNQLYEWLQIRSHRRFDAVCAVSSAIQARLDRAGVRKVHVLRNAWAGARNPVARDEARQALEVPPGVFDLGWVGRISHEKGLDVLIQAMPYLNDLPVHLTVLGDGGERERVETAANALGISHRITWAGIVADAGKYFRAFDALVLSSRTEGTPVTLLEAMGATVPIVTAAVGGIPDVVSSREAQLVPPEDPAALAAAIRTVVIDRAAAAERAASAYVRLQSELALDPWLDGYERIYKSLKPASSLRSV